MRKVVGIVFNLRDIYKDLDRKILIRNTKKASKYEKDFFRGKKHNKGK